MAYHTDISIENALNHIACEESIFSYINGQQIWIVFYVCPKTPLLADRYRSGDIQSPEICVIRQICPEGKTLGVESAGEKNAQQKNDNLFHH